jgi:hypothetical protein
MITSVYFNYFRQLAVRHKDLRHDPDTETGNGPKGKKRFARFSEEEILAGLKNKVTFPALLADHYEIRTKAASNLVIDKKYAAAINVFATADPESAAEKEAAFDLAERILNDIIRQMYQDHEGDGVDVCNTPFGEIDFDGMEIIPVGPVLNSEFGFRCMFNFNFRNDQSFTTAPAPGTFLNV